MEITEILEKLCAEKGISGREDEMSETLSGLLRFARIEKRPDGTLIAMMGDLNAPHHILFDAHLDRIGLIVTFINDKGFLKVSPVGGADLRSLPGSPVVVIANDGQEIAGVICTMPPHLSKDNRIEKDNLWVDTGLSAEQIKESVEPGCSVIVRSHFRRLLGDRVAVSALDNRAGCAVLVKCAWLLKDKPLSCRISFVFSSQEETNESGAKTAAFYLRPDEAVAVDVGFASQEGVPSDKSGRHGCGAIISIAPVLSRAVTDRLISIAKEIGCEPDFEVDGGSTGTNADAIAASCGGVRCGVLSVPEKNMHTQTECVQLSDIEACAKILAIFAERGGTEGV